MVREFLRRLKKHRFRTSNKIWYIAARSCFSSYQMMKIDKTMMYMMKKEVLKENDYFTKRKEECTYIVAQGLLMLYN